MKSWLSIMLCLVSLSVHTIAQTRTISGVVTDSLHVPLAGVSVVLSEPGQSAVRGFTTTNDQGIYQLQLSGIGIKPYALTVRFLGHAETTQLIDTVSANRVYNFLMIPMLQQLKEVIVRAPITQRNDTTSYDLRQFVDTASVEKLESILKRLPGFEVADNGTLYFKGRQVDQLLLDGDNLFQSRYTIATQNLRANLIDKVQAIENYQPNQLLKGLKESNKVAVNLTVKSEKRKIFAGSADVATNGIDRYEGSLHGLTYWKTLKTVSIADLNNTRAAGVVPELESSHDKSESPFVPETNVVGKIDLSPWLPNALPPNRTINRQSFSGAINLANTWAKNIKSQGYVMAIGDKSANSWQTDETYQRAASFRIWEQQTNRQQGKRVSSQHEISWLVHPRTQLRLGSWLDLSPQVAQRSLTGSLITKPISEQLIYKPLSHLNRLYVVHRLNDRNAFQANLQYAENQFRQTYNVPMLGLLDQPSALLDQSNLFSRRQVAVTAEWLWQSRKGVSGFMEVGATKGVQQRSIVTLFNGDKSTDSLTITSLKYTYHHANLLARYLMRQTELSIGSRFVYADMEAKSNQLSQAFWEPNLSIRHRFSTTRQLLLSYKYFFDDQTLTNFFPTTLVTGYRTHYTGLASFAYWGNHLALATYSHQDILASRRLAITFLLSSAENSLLNSLQITPSRLISERILANRAVQLTSINGSVEQLIIPLDLMVKAKIGVTQVERYVQFSTTPQRIRSQSQVYKLEANTVFNGPISLNLATQYTVSNSLTDQSSKLPVLQVAELIVQSKLAVNLHNQWRGRLQGQHVYTFTNSGMTANKFFDAHVDYTPSKSKWTFQLDGRNLLNARQFFFQQVSDVSVSAQSYTLLGRWIIAGVGYTF